MADFNKITAVTNGSVTFTTSAGASSQTVSVGKDERMCIYIKNGGTSAITATVVKGNGIASVMGNLAVSVPAGSEVIIGPLESARFVDTSTGKITVNLSGTTSVTIAAIQL